jgi:AcrR family transcriptional regulator
VGRPQRVTDEQVFTAVRAAVLEFGPGVSLDTVAAKLSVTSPALLKRFKSRTELLLSALRPREHPPWMADLERGPSDEALTVQLETIFGRILEFFLEVMPFMKALRENGLSIDEICGDRESGPLRGVRALARWLTAARAAGLIASNTIESTAFAMIGAVQARAVVAHFSKRALSERQQRQYLRDIAKMFSLVLQPRLPPMPRSRVRGRKRVHHER